MLSHGFRLAFIKKQSTFFNRVERMANRTKETPKKDFPEILQRSYGVIFSACSYLGVCRSTYYRWCEEDAEFKALCERAIKIGQENGLDFTESKLYQNIADNKEASIFFNLKTKGKHRGYVEKEEKALEIDDFKRRVLSILTDDQLKTLLTIKGDD